LTDLPGLYREVKGSTDKSKRRKDLEAEYLLKGLERERRGAGKEGKYG